MLDLTKSLAVNHYKDNQVNIQGECIWMREQLVKRIYLIKPIGRILLFILEKKRN